MTHHAPADQIHQSLASDLARIDEILMSQGFREINATIDEIVEDIARIDRLAVERAAMLTASPLGRLELRTRTPEELARGETSGHCLDLGATLETFGAMSIRRKELIERLRALHRVKLRWMSAADRRPRAAR